MDEQNFYREFYKVMSRHNNAKILMEKLESSGEVILFGGAVREYIDSSYRELPRDFDIVYKKKSYELGLDELLLGFNYKKNRFDGYKVVVDGLEFDIWDINDTWAFKKNKIICDKNQYVEKLTETVFLNIDSIVFNINESKFNGGRYSEAIENKCLDIILEENPFLELNLLRAILYKRKYNMSLSKKLIAIFRNFIEKNTNYVDVLYDIQLSHYDIEKIKKNELKKELLNIL